MATLIVHDIYEGSLDDIITAYERDKELTILLDSYGGDLYSGYFIYDYLKGKPNVKCHVIGNCMSAASLVLLACSPENRTAAEHAQVMIHRPLLFWFGTLTQNECQDVDADIERETKKLVDIYKRELAISEDIIYSMLDAEQIIGAQTAKAFGFVSSVENSGASIGNVATAKNADRMADTASAKAVVAQIERNKQLIFNHTRK